jgi:predicted site-specific integrase-resolvase
MISGGEFFGMSERVVIYARVSTDNQTHDSQLDEVRSYSSRPCVQCGLP